MEVKGHCELMSVSLSSMVHLRNSWRDFPYIWHKQMSPIGLMDELIRLLWIDIHVNSIFTGWKRHTVWVGNTRYLFYINTSTSLTWRVCPLKCFAKQSIEDMASGYAVWFQSMVGPHHNLQLKGYAIDVLMLATQGNHQRSSRVHSLVGQSCLVSRKGPTQY